MPATTSRSWPAESCPSRAEGRRGGEGQLLFDALLEALARPERCVLLGRDRDRLARARVHALAGVAATGLERAEARDLDLAAGVELDGDDALARGGREDGVDDLVGLGLGEPSLL